MQDKDQFGFYRVGDLKFYSKLDAINMHTKTGVHPHWDFNETVFSSHDWTKEPIESLRELYRRRAQQIRNKYDYVVIWYSAGPDSDNIVHSFLNNGIKVDEIVSYINYEGSGEKDNFMNNEIYKVAHPQIESKFKKLQPDLKYRVVDASQSIVDHFETFGTDWVYLQNTMFNPNNASRPSLRYLVPEWKKMIDAGKRVVFVWGVDKPRLYIVDGKYCLRFLDIVDTCVSPQQQSIPKPGEFDELFYWSPDLPEIPIKQGHIVKNYLQHAEKTDMYLGKETTWLAYKDIDDERYWLSGHGLHTLIYPDYEFKAECANTKTRSVFWTPRDKWFYKLSPENNVARRNWAEGLRKLWKLTPDYWKNDPTDPNKSMKQCMSIPYFLE